MLSKGFLAVTDLGTRYLGTRQMFKTEIASVLVPGCSFVW